VEKNISGLDLVVVVITSTCLLFVLVFFTLQTIMYGSHQGTFAFGLLAWILHLGFLFWFFFVENNSVITKEQ
jgi:hypothetical protein